MAPKPYFRRTWSMIPSARSLFSRRSSRLICSATASAATRLSYQLSDGSAEIVATLCLDAALPTAY
ncbi:hypothetical protein [Streptomyces sp. NPDC001914]|uniref:hypothetical protein n=1 Tax=Streptomyces sp. NPDC001914 TaxID=3364623 RepID=UPI00367B4409